MPAIPASSEAEPVFPVGTYTEHKYATHKSIYMAGHIEPHGQTETFSLTALSYFPLLAG